MKIQNIILGILAAISITACASAPIEKQIDAKVANENNVKSRSDLQSEADQLIKNSPDLTDDQRSKFLALRDSSRKESEQLREESLKLRAVMVKQLFSPNYDAAQIKVLKKKIAEVEHDRQRLFFKTIHSANEIMGRWGSRRERESESLYNNMMSNMDLNHL